MLDNIGADSLRFTPEKLGEVNAAWVRAPVHGARLPAMVLHSLVLKRPQSRNARNAERIIEITE